jgi:hypothetical protein
LRFLKTVVVERSDIFVRNGDIEGNTGKKITVVSRQKRRGEKNPICLFSKHVSHIHGAMMPWREKNNMIQYNLMMYSSMGAQFL